jgi:hypothetical protein
MRVKEILEHFLSRADWVDHETTVGRGIVGDTGTEIDCCLVSWMPSFEVLCHIVRRRW